MIRRRYSACRRYSLSSNSDEDSTKRFGCLLLAEFRASPCSCLASTPDASRVARLTLVVRHALEALTYYIDPPRRLEAAFDAVTPDLAAAGETIFCRICAGCHKYSQDQRTSAGLIRLHGMRHRRRRPAPDLLSSIWSVGLSKPDRLAPLEFSKRPYERPRQESATKFQRTGQEQTQQFAQRLEDLRYPI
jgi:hypothetical protein